MISLTKVQSSTDSRRCQCLKVLTSTVVVVLLLSVLTFSSSSIVVVTAYPSGAGTCAAGNKVGTPGHTIDGGTILEAFTLKLSVNGVAVTDGDTIDIPSSTATEIIIDGGTFEGISIRLDNGATIVTSDDTVYKNNDFCAEPVAGITHLDSSEKTIASATITPSITSGTIVLDIFAVMEKSDPYGYSTYTLNIVSDDATTTTTTTTPTKAPVDAGAGAGGDKNTTTTTKTKAPGAAAKTKAPAATEGAAPNATAPTATPPAAAAAASNSLMNVIMSATPCIFIVSMGLSFL